jgi:hypothetical protein
MLCDVCLFALYLIVVPLPPSKTPFAIKLNNNNYNNMEPGRAIFTYSSASYFYFLFLVFSSSFPNNVYISHILHSPLS